MVSEAQKRAIKKFESTNIKQITLKFNIRTDADILEQLAGIKESKLGYIKRLIREDIQKNKVQ